MSEDGLKFFRKFLVSQWAAGGYISLGFQPIYGIHMCLTKTQAPTATNHGFPNVR